MSWKVAVGEELLGGPEKSLRIVASDGDRLCTVYVEQPYRAHILSNAFRVLANTLDKEPRS